MKKDGAAAGQGARIQGARVAIVYTQWNPQVVEPLLAGARRRLADCAVSDEDIEVVLVPGAWEIPLALDRLARSGRYDGLVALGAVIRGETPHFDFVAGECAAGVSRVSLDHGIPIGFGLLTTNNQEQAVARSGPGEDNKGCEAVAAMADMIALLRRIDG